MSSWEAACDQCARAYERVGTLLDQGEVSEAARVLEENGTTLLKLGLTPGDDASEPVDQPAAGPDRPDDRIVPADGTIYAAGEARAIRLRMLLRQAQELLGRCETIEARTMEELRTLRVGQSFQSAVSGAGGWLSRKA